MDECLEVVATEKNCFAFNDAMTTQALDTTKHVRECKAQLFHALQRRHRDAWRTYWSSFQQYLLAKMPIEHFHATAEQLLGKEHIMLHNTFVVALLQDCSTSGEEAQPDGYNTSDWSAGSSEHESVTNEIKTEIQNQRDDPVDTESAKLLMGLGTFVSH